jgi:hypothetical protein
MATVQVENLVVGKKYIVDGAVKTLTQKTFNDHPQNPSFTLTFDNASDQSERLSFTTLSKSQ